MGQDFEWEALNWRDYLVIAKRRRWSLMGPFFAIGFIGFLVALVWPNSYRSEALILVEEQRVPEQYVMPNVATDLQNRLQSMTQQILSRTRLQRLIQQFNLYSRERAHMTLDELVDRMRKDIQVEPISAPGRQGDVTAFRISFTGDTPRLAQQITNELTSLFIEQNLQARTQSSESTTNFLENQLGQARKDLEEQETRLREFKGRFLGELPEQQQANLQILSSLQTQLQTVSAALDQAEQEKTYLESLKTQYQALQSSIAAQSKTSSMSTSSPTNPMLTDLQNQLASLEARYTSRHPDVIKLKEQIAQLKAQSVSPPGAKPGVEAGAPSISASPTDAQSLVQIDSRLKANALEIADREKDIADLRSKIQVIQGRLNLTPVREQELAEVTRNYENSKAYYQSLLQKKLQSSLATNLEIRQQGEQFRIIDAPTLPEKPIEPNRGQIVLIGWALGICAGVSLCAFREFTDGSLRTRKDISRYVNIPVLISVPVLRTREEESRAKLVRIMELAGVLLLVLLSIGTGLYAYWVV